MTNSPAKERRSLRAVSPVTNDAATLPASLVQTPQNIFATLPAGLGAPISENVVPPAEQRTEVHHLANTSTVSTPSAKPEKHQGAPTTIESEQHLTSPVQVIKQEGATRQPV